MKKTLAMLACIALVTPAFAAINVVATADGSDLTLSNSYSTTVDNISSGKTGTTSLEGGILTTTGDGYAYVKSTGVDGNGGYSFSSFDTEFSVTLGSLSANDDFNSLIEVATTYKTDGSESFAIGFVDGKWAIGTTSSWWSYGSGGSLNFTSTVGEVVTTGSHELTLVCSTTGSSTSLTLKEGETTLVSATGNFGQSNGLDTLYLGLGGTRANTVYYTEQESARKGLTSTGVAATFVTPEPATATLSLLALAGLASRRRRH